MKNDFLPKKFFVTSGKGVSRISELNAFDMALADAGISQCNLVEVSSILPKGCEEVRQIPIDAGTITFAVISRADGKNGETVSSGIAWALQRKGYGIVAEDHNHGAEDELKLNLRKRIEEMAESRGIKLEKVEIRTGTCTAPKDGFCCAVAVLVYVF
jgi:arginine decarboxylase